MRIKVGEKVAKLEDIQNNPGQKGVRMRRGRFLPVWQIPGCPGASGGESCGKCQ